MHVLLVEDDDVIRDTLSGLLAEARLDVSKYATAEAALDQEQKPPVVLITDINLGSGMDGIELASVAQRRWPQVSVVFITGQPWRVDRQSLRSNDRCLAKPFRGSELLQAVSEVASGPPTYQ